MEDLSNKTIKPRVLCEKYRIIVDDIMVDDVVIFEDDLAHVGYCIIFLSEDRNYCRVIPIHEIHSCTSDDTERLKIVLSKGTILQIIKVGKEEL